MRGREHFPDLSEKKRKEEKKGREIWPRDTDVCIYRNKQSLQSVVLSHSSCMYITRGCLVFVVKTRGTFGISSLSGHQFVVNTFSERLDLCIDARNVFVHNVDFIACVQARSASYSSIIGVNVNARVPPSPLWRTFQFLLAIATIWAWKPRISNDYSNRLYRR